MRSPPSGSPLLALAAALLSLAPGCRSRDADANGRPAPRTYAIRGEVVALVAGSSGRQLLLRHEPIDGFVDAAGKVVGMDSMVMPFDLAPAVRDEKLAPGDRIEAVLAVDLSKPMMRIESLRKLPPGTPLRLGKAEPGARERGRGAITP